MSQISRDRTSQRSPDRWAEIIEQLIDRLIGKNMLMTYDFQNLTIDVPKAEGPGGEYIGSVKWTINGKIIITSEVHDKSNQDKK